MADNRKYVQAQPFTLYGSGASLGDTSLTLSTFNGIDGVALTMTDFGTKGFGTIEPGAGTSEEQISWTGVTANANGTTTLTGVKTVGFISPYTESSGLAKSHAGATRFVVSNTAGFYDGFTNKNDDETIAGTWTFTSPNYPKMDTAAVAPVADAEFATKKYVDDTAIAGSPKATEAVFGITRLSTAAVDPAIPIAVGDNDTRVPTQNENNALVGNNTDIAVGTGNKYVTQTGLQKSAETYATSTTGNDTYVVTLSPVPTSYASGMTFRMKPDTANTGAATVNVNGLGAKSILKNGAAALADGDIPANSVVTLVYDGTQFILQGTTFMTSANNTTLTGGVASNADSLHTHSIQVLQDRFDSDTYVQIDVPVCSTATTGSLSGGWRDLTGNATFGPNSMRFSPTNSNNAEVLTYNYTGNGPASSSEPIIPGLNCNDRFYITYKFAASGDSNDDVYVGFTDDATQSTPANADRAAFFFVDNGVLKCISMDGTATETTTPTNITYTRMNLLTIFHDSASTKFYVNNSLVATHSTRTPSGSNTVYGMFRYEAGGSGTHSAEVVGPVRVYANISDWNPNG